MFVLRLKMMTFYLPHKLATEDKVVSMAVIRHVNASSEERTAYFKMRRAISDGETPGNDITQERYEELSELEDWILIITQGVAAANLDRRDDTVVAAFTVHEEDQIMLATSTGQSIRCPVSGISLQGRSSSGVTVFNTKDGENGSFLFTQ